VPNVAETYVALAAVYRPKPITAAASTDRNADSSRVLGSPRTGHSDARPATSGKTPSPIANAPAARRPSVNILCLKWSVAISHSV
jgi:hypothetical protein